VCEPTWDSRVGASVNTKVDCTKLMNENGQVTSWLMLPQLVEVVKAVIYWVTGIALTVLDMV
jgi:hypothetical protein